MSLQNFKGFKSKAVFQFDNDNTLVNILSGPNGFGKTTIFDVIEICLTGEFKRVDFFDNVQKKTNNKKKPFFQNTDGEDVILKLWLYDSATNMDNIIIKYYDDDKSPTKWTWGRDFIPSDAGKIFTTYLTTDIAYFTENNFVDLEKVEQSNINALFYGNGSTTDIKSTYYLFNYIQQEDSIYFLRKSEDDKGASLGFLFNIEKEETEKQKLQTLKSNLTRQQTSIQQQIALLMESLPNAQKGDYEKLFQDKNFDFDQEKPFTQISTARENLSSFRDVLDSLLLLRNSFSPEEYKKSLKFKKLNDEILGNQQILKAILIKKIFTEHLLTSLEVTNAKIIKAHNFFQAPRTSFIPKEYFDLFLPEVKEYTEYLIIESSIKQLDRDLGEIGRIISELNLNRNKTIEQFKKLSHTNHISDKNCPLCDTRFESIATLEKEITAKTITLEVYNVEKLKQKSKLQDQLKLIVGRISKSAKVFITENNTTEPSVLALFREYTSLKGKIEEIFTIYPILDSLEMETINFTHLPQTMAEILEKQDLLKAFLEREILSQLTYQEHLIENKHLYIQYFDSDLSKFNSISIDMLSTKLQYILGSYAQIANSRLMFLDSRNQKLTTLLGHITTIYEKVHKTIQDHKAEMIEKIKVPFYIYSGKILQSYQQGMGVFVEIHSTDQNNNVRFKTGHASDHDIVYHLSSGQMAAVALAFCLSLNKVFNTNEHFKFLSIDDPIQTMDDLNIHTFIELLRNEFKEYQIILSTHDDFTSRYMKYKFDKFAMNTEIQNVQKIVLEQSV